MYMYRYLSTSVAFTSPLAPVASPRARGRRGACDRLSRRATATRGCAPSVVSPAVLLVLLTLLVLHCLESSLGSGSGEVEEREERGWRRSK
jgi:hypothetical protein